MIAASRRTRSPGLLLLVACALLAVAIALYDYFAAPGIAGTEGALLVVVSTVLLVLGGGVLLAGPPRWLRVLLQVLVLLDLLGTALAAWFLISWPLLLAVTVAAAGFLADLFLDPAYRQPRRTP